MKKIKQLLEHWFIQKITLNENPTPPRFFRERQVWMATIGVNIGREQNGGGANFSRPVLIISKLSAETVLVLPLSSQVKDSKFRAKISFKNKLSDILLDQARVIDQKRLSYRMENLDKAIFNNIKNKFIKLIQ